jgi:UDP-3-O-[3-hydroxymyristoyl] N-acetylglucosamine deacetylase
MREKTVKNTVKISGKTLHKGSNSTIVLKPLPENSGIYFIKDGVKIPLLPEFVIDTTMATTIGKDGVNIHTVEHLMSAVISLGISNLEIEINSNEPPILDGSSIKFLEAIEKVGTIEQNSNRKTLVIKKEVKIEDGKRFVSISPKKGGFSIKSTIDFKNKAIGIQNFEIDITEESYKKEIAPARTFGFLKDFDMLKSQNLALGADYSNVIVIGDDEVLNKDGLRFENEFVRHKILDVIGDFAVLGMNIEGEYKSFASSHYLNYKLIQKILSDEKNYDVKS